MACPTLFKGGFKGEVKIAMNESNIALFAERLWLKAY